jgi:hypothetical protein
LQRSRTWLSAITACVLKEGTDDDCDPEKTAAQLAEHHAVHHLILERSGIKDHGPIDVVNIGSAVKRIVGKLQNAELGELAAADMGRRR